MACGESQAEMEKRLQELQKQLGKKNMFEQSVSSIHSLFLNSYPSSSASLRNSMYSAVCRVATILQTRYTAPGFWLAGLRLFEDAERLVTESPQKKHLKTCIAKAREHLHETENRPEVTENNTRRGIIPQLSKWSYLVTWNYEVTENNTRRDSRYLFEGHLTVEQEPPPPSWLVAQNLLTAFAATQEWNATAESSHSHGENTRTSESIPGVHSPEIIQELMNSMQDDLQDLESVIEASLQEIGAGPQRPPPASKEVVAKLPIIIVTDEILGRLGSETECAVCRENLVINDNMQELPCKHLFHPVCLKPWLDAHNSCPICRFELQTDDHAYESWKEREKEAEEERKGAANAVRGGEYMYV